MYERLHNYIKMVDCRESAAFLNFKLEIMEETLVKFKTAKLAKEKGFHLDLCNTGWHGDFGALVGDNYPFLGTYSYLTSIHCNNKDEHQIQRPTQSLLQKWLREEKKCFICVKHRIIGSVENPIIEYTYNGNNGEWNQKYYKTYEEALEEALKESLSLI